MLEKLDHIGIAVSDLEKAIDAYSLLTGVSSPEIEEVLKQEVRTAFFPVSGFKIELLEGTSSNSVISKFVEKRGEGIHHLCFRVEDLDSSKRRLEEGGFSFVTLNSEVGAGDTRVAFAHPKSTNGVLIELVEYPAAQ